MDYNIHYRTKDKGIQVIISYKLNSKWRQINKQGFENSRNGKKAAKDWAADALNDLKNKIPCDKHLENMTFKEFYDMYIEHLKLHVAYKTLEQYKYSMNAFSCLHDIAVNEITSANIQSGIDELIKCGLADYTIKKYVDRIRTLLNAAKDKYNIIATNP